MLQFADIARPVVRGQRVDRGRCEALDRAARTGGRGAEEVRREHGDVGLPIPQRRHLDGHHVDPPEEVGPKPAGGHERLEALVGGEDHSGIDAMSLRAAHRLELHVLKHAEEFYLHRRRGRGDFIEEDRAAVGEQELAVAVAGGAGERAGHVTKQFALEQRLTEAPTRHLHEPPLAAAAAMDLPGEQRLAGAALAGDQHRGRGGGNAVDDVENPGHGRMAAEDGRFDVGSAATAGCGCGLDRRE